MMETEMHLHSTSPPRGRRHNSYFDISTVGLTAITGWRSGAVGDIGLVACNLKSSTKGVSNFAAAAGCLT